MANVNILITKLSLLIRTSSFDTTTAEGRSKERYRRIALTTAASVITKGVSVSTTLISVPLTLNYLGTERYGLWMTISSVISMLGFADLGMGNGLLNAISEANGKDDRKTARICVSSTFFMLLAIAILILAVFASVYGFIPWQRIFNVTSDLAVQESGPTMAVLVASFALNMPLGVVQRVQMGYQEDYKNQLWAIAGSLIGLGGVLLAIYLKAGLPWLVLAMSGGPVLAQLINWIVLFCWSRTWLFPKWKAFNWSASLKIASTGTWFFVLQLFTVIGTYSDNLVIAQTLGASEVASYAVTQKLFSTAFISQYFITPLWPAFGEAMAHADYNWARRTLNRTLILSLSIGFVTALILFIFAKPIITLWVGSDLVPTTFLLIGFGFWLPLVGYIGTMSTFLNSGSLLRRQVIFFCTTSMMSLILKVVLVHQWQSAGVIWATIFAYSLFYVIPAAKLAYGSLKFTDIR
jgi:O-antigen/teichoic acid export membrane protein